MLNDKHKYLNHRLRAGGGRGTSLERAAQSSINKEIATNHRDDA